MPILGCCIPLASVLTAVPVDPVWPFQSFKVRKRVGVVLCVHKCISVNWHRYVEYIHHVRWLVSGLISPADAGLL